MFKNELDYPLRAVQTGNVKETLLAKVAAVVGRERKRRGMSLRDVAEAAGGHTAASSIHRLDHTASVDLLCRVLAVFGFELVPRRKRQL